MCNNDMQDQEFVEYIVKSLVDNPGDVGVRELRPQGVEDG